MTRQLTPTLAELDTHLGSFDPDGLPWADGGGAERADELLVALAPDEWTALAGLVAQRKRAWRRCLGSALAPGQGEEAQELLLALAVDRSVDVAFEAVTAIAFSCGVNANEKGPFIDPEIIDEEFLTRARSTPGLIAEVERVAASCSPHFASVLQTLVGQLRA